MTAWCLDPKNPRDAKFGPVEDEGVESPGSGASGAEVQLVCMPFGPVFSPSLGLSLLAAGLRRHGVSVRIRYFTIPFAERVGQAFYSGIATEGRPSNRDLAGEWVFAAELFPDDEDRARRYVERILLRKHLAPETRLEPPATPALVRRLQQARRRVPEFLDWCAREIAGDELQPPPRVLGFTSVFQQHVASLALARRVKRLRPETFVVFGGANCEGPMGLETLRQFAWVDAVVSGEADLVFPELVEHVLRGEEVSHLCGVATQSTARRRHEPPPAPMVREMDDLPRADFGEYFEQFGSSRYAREWQPSIYLETSRGCWWGERQHCTFCGLNGGSMAYRSKSPARVLDELSELVARHPGCDVQVVDNILDLAYFRNLLPELARRRLGVGLFYETKANLKRDQVRLLRDAGITKIQPGIESLSDDVLKLMRKGVSALQNIQLLKWCKEIGVEPHWNVLWGFAGEPPEEYASMARLVPWLTHLQPPTGFGSVRIDRFSPNFFDAERLGFTNLRPAEPYALVYDLPRAALHDLAYYFTYEHREPQPVAEYTAGLARELRAWQREARRSDLFYEDTGTELLLWDLRPAARSALTLLRGVDRLLYLACDDAATSEQLSRRLLAAGASAAPEAVDERLAPLCESGLVIAAGARYLALAVRLGDYVPGPLVTRRFRHTARALGRSIPWGASVPLEGRFVTHDRACWPARRTAGRARRGPPRGRRLPRFAVRGESVLEIRWGA